MTEGPREFYPELLSRRGEILAWLFAILTGLSLLVFYRYGGRAPFVAWLSERAEVSDDELAELESLVAQLQSQRKER